MEQLSVMQKIFKFQLLHNLIQIRGLNFHLLTLAKMSCNAFGLLVQKLSGWTWEAFHDQNLVRAALTSVLSSSVEEHLGQPQFNIFLTKGKKYLVIVLKIMDVKVLFM